MKKCIKICFALMLVLFLFACSKPTTNVSNNVVGEESEEITEVINNTINDEVNESIKKIENTEDVKTININGGTPKKLEIRNIKKVLDYDERTLPENMDSIIFGKYEQDNDQNNGKEDIEWNILSLDGNYLFLISKYVLCSVPFQSDKVMNDWYKSELRSWLNAYFYNNAFDENEKNAIVRRTYENTSINAYYKVGYQYNNTDDLVSIISYDEIVKYMGKPGEKPEGQFHNRRLCTKPTEYAKKANDLLFIEKSINFCKGCTQYWIRNLHASGNGPYCGACCTIFNDGTVLYDELDSDRVGVRPIIYIDLSKLDDDKKTYMTSKCEVVSAFTENNSSINNILETRAFETNSLNSWEMKLFTKSLDEFKSAIIKKNDERASGKTDEVSPKYIINADGSSTFTYGLRDVDKDDVKELLIYSGNNLMAIYKLLNDYYEDYVNYKDMFYPQNVYDGGLYMGEAATAFESNIYGDNYLVEKLVYESKQEYLSDEYLTARDKQEIYESNNYIEYIYTTLYVNGEEMELYNGFNYRTNAKDGLGEFEDNDENVQKLTKEEGEKRIYTHGNPIVLKDGVLVVK